MNEVDYEKLEIIPAYNIYAGYMKTGNDSGFAKAFAKGLIYENAGLTPTYLLDREESCLYVLPHEYLNKTVTIH